MIIKRSLSLTFLRYIQLSSKQIVNRDIIRSQYTKVYGAKNSREYLKLFTPLLQISNELVVVIVHARRNSAKSNHHYHKTVIAQIFKAKQSKAPSMFKLDVEHMMHMVEVKKFNTMDDRFKCEIKEIYFPGTRNKDGTTASAMKYFQSQAAKGLYVAE
ncbi:predicted protein [Sclerotinia sclerotiorum 1980 UF-70]|uniref:Uncharacterized protein n=1 Tax=Sclerotinia sclerotiorum (strain ATCC 18683 / 1980 / Ss-1) TaxID=665079 RepID=A7F0T1_SCLS1|nr:predicted protein [Sclerotinia sclerotiorum 1980 UF-70]EDN95323.1 predicted protein [Sclerotinia sclerotiorum 1980 UF-70]